MKLDIVGQSVVRVDALAKLTGKATYPQDLYMDGMLYGKTVRSEKAHAFFTIDKSKAEAIEGVVKVLTAEDVPGHNHHGVLFKDHEVFCAKKARRVGDPIAFIVAESEKIAEVAFKAIEIKYEEIPAVFDPEEAMKDEIQVHDGKSNIIFHYKLRNGDVEEGFKKCAAIAENTYNTQMVEHAFLQPEAGLAYVDKDGTIVVACATQYPHFDQIEVAEALGIPTEKVRIINPAVGGAFGAREDLTLQAHIAIAAVVTGKPVKCVYSREESFVAHSKRHPEKIYIKTGADKDGKLIALEARIVGDSGAYASWAINVLRKSGVHVPGPYEIENVKVDSYAVYTNNPFTGAFRGFGATQVPVATEQNMDILAEKLGISPVEIRLKNALRVGSKTATGQTLSESVPLVQCIEEVSKRLNLVEGGDK